MNDNKRKWPTILGQVLFIIACAAFGFFGAYYYGDLFTRIFSFSNLLLTFFVILLSFPLHIFLHEIGHVIGGLASGYDLMMFRLFNHMWLKTEKGISYRKQFVPGMLGQALMSPPKTEKKDDKVPFFLYHVSGILMNGITAFLFILAANDLNNDMLSYILYISAGVALFLMLTNAIPIRGTDGYNILQQFQREEANREITNSLYMYRDMILGANFQYLQKYVDLDAFASLENPNAVTMHILHAASFLEINEFDKAREVYEYLWQNLDHLLELQKPDVIFNYLFALLVTEPAHPEIPHLLEHPLVKQYKSLKQADVYRVLAAAALYFEEDLDKAEGLLDEGEKLLQYAPTVSEENLETYLYQYLRKELILQKHEKVLE